MVTCCLTHVIAGFSNSQSSFQISVSRPFSLCIGFGLSLLTEFQGRLKSVKIIQRTLVKYK